MIEDKGRRGERSIFSLLKLFLIVTWLELHNHPSELSPASRQRGRSAAKAQEIERRPSSVFFKTLSYGFVREPAGLRWGGWQCGGGLAEAWQQL